MKEPKQNENEEFTGDLPTKDSTLELKQSEKSEVAGDLQAEVVAANCYHPLALSFSDCNGFVVSSASNLEYEQINDPKMEEGHESTSSNWYVPSE
ncbi:hypothetical protein FH972_000840 [Carpinus fangiana]|uniref:Uncharacterized protein n=1 Tax=Carpinus fangiana TaxID=176857 RepID=A0A5N6Q9Y0_9ROSI|nr:hypothetical protein FH972_000840 [Carpinus fangiana]